MKVLYEFVVLIAVFAIVNCGKRDKIKLKDIEVLTLHKGKMTTGRRTSPVPQLTCIGGTAGCRSYQPDVVQCSNKGSDGYDIQWQCKAEMDNKYKFGKVEITCEGYDYPDDSYVLVGSCGLEYTLDYVKDKPYKEKQSFYNNKYNEPKIVKSENPSVIFVVVIVCAIALIYFTCIRVPKPREATPPPPGFRFTSESEGYGSDSSFGQDKSTGGHGFWSGFLTGGTLGYLFGRNNTNYRDESSYFGTSSTSSYSSTRSSDSDDSTTRTTSGFGGTKRR